MFQILNYLFTKSSCYRCKKNDMVEYYNHDFCLHCDYYEYKVAKHAIGKHKRKVN
jgi:hypothetical protein